MDDRISSADEQYGAYGTGKLKNTNWLDLTFISQLPKLVEYVGKLMSICMESAIKAAVGPISATKIYALDSLPNAGFSMLDRSKTSSVKYVPYMDLLLLFIC